MQTSAFNKRHGGERHTILGIDADKLASLPSNVRGDVLTALSAAEEARRAGDEAAATNIVTKLLGTLEAHHAETVVERFFLGSLRPVRGDHEAVRKFAGRAGVKTR